ncbi:transposase [Streptomyces sp. CG1]|uniref:IS701 family transposase n=1 Tax=Streptomyces sp. CG1 TaxID=1287523 RepID=UPI0034E1B079
MSVRAGAWRTTRPGSTTSSFSLAQRRGFREYLTGLLAPRERNKTITCLAGAEPVAGAGMPGVQRLQFFLSESPWEVEQVNDPRLELLREQPAAAPHDSGVIVIDDSGDRKDGTTTAHVGRQWLGRLGKTDNGIDTVTTVWTDGRVYYPLHATPYTPAHHFARGRLDPAFRTKPQLAAALAARGKEAGFGCRAVVADCAYSVSDDWYLALREAGLAYVVALKPHRGTWARGDQPHTPVEDAHALAWRDAKRPGDWTPVQRHFRDGHTETWWAADARLGGYGPDSPCRLVVATTDPAGLPEKATWYPDAAWAAARLAEVLGDPLPCCRPLACRYVRACHARSHGRLDHPGCRGCSVGRFDGRQYCADGFWGIHLLSCPCPGGVRPARRPCGGDGEGERRSVECSGG